MKAPKSPARMLKAMALAVLLAPAASLPASAQYQLIDLGTDVTPNDINNLGTVVGSRIVGGASVAFRWTPGTGVIEDIVAGTVANAVNDSGQITGNTLTGAFLLDGNLREWDGFGGYGINEYGQISGYKELANPYRATPMPFDPAIYTPNKWDNLGVAQTYSRGTGRESTPISMFSTTSTTSATPSAEGGNTAS